MQKIARNLRNTGLLAPVLLALITIAFFYRVLFLGEVFVVGDNLSINVPSKILLLHALQGKTLPLWNRRVPN